ncbi:MAG TPA: NAD(P)/FAD-dependent oxidoreductase [Verrucomicrobiae bacterium]|jgi:NADH dehydrogenase|nr:NAD(P)/FAD-dependent oxidoreductase [Verrucomicrobiae bacterium]
MNEHAIPKVVIVGAGFGGLKAAEALVRLSVQITVIDRKNHHTFQPLLYQVATAGLSPAEIAAPIREILHRYKNVEVLLGEVQEFDLQRRVVRLHGHEISYDYLIVAAGATHAYFGHDDWEPLAPGLKTIEDALEIRRRILLAYELAEREAALTGMHRPLNFVVVGAGPTGVELAGTLAEIARKSLPKNFRHIDPTKTRILLVEAGPSILNSYPEDLQRSAVSQLQHLGVEVITDSPVTEVRSGQVRIGEESVPAEVVLWAAGVSASSLGPALGAPVDKAGRVLVEPDLSLPGHREVFVIGDLATLNDKDGKPLPGVAPVAMQQGTFAARQIKADLNGKPREAFHYFDKGSLATIGRAAAIAQFGKIHISGFIAWLSWLFIHILFLIGFRNRIVVMLQWAWSYLTYERAAWLITGASRVVTVPSMEYAERASISANLPAEETPQEAQAIAKRSA